MPKNTVAIPLGDMKTAGSGMTNNSLRKDFNFFCNFVKIKKNNSVKLEFLDYLELFKVFKLLRVFRIFEKL